MEALDLARLQFAITTGIHWIFVLLTMGLVPLVAVMHTAGARTTRFWGQLYVINYALGIVTGLVMEFQFGLSWSGLSAFAGNVFGAPLALETLVAFFAESTFLGMWIFGWGRLPRWLHVTLIWLVALTAYASAYWILVANGFMQHPVGFAIKDGVAVLTDFGAMLANPNALVAFGHVTAAALLTGGLFVAAVSAYHRFRRPMRLGLVVAAVATLPVFALGGAQYPLLQKEKLAAITGGFTWTAAAQYVMVYLGYLVSLITLLGVVVAFRAAFRRWWPLVALLYPVPVSVFAGGLLFGEPGPYLWQVYAGSAALVLGLLFVRWKPPMWAVVAVVPLPFAASIAGWVFREVGRQPWLVYGQLTVEQALSQVGSGTLLASFVAFCAVFVALAVADWVLIVRYARRGLERVPLGAAEQPLMF